MKCEKYYMEIQMTGIRKGITVISKEDYDYYSKCCIYQDAGGYARCCINKKTSFLHRHLMKAPNGKKVDHIDGNKLNNQRENLRITTTQLNNQNRRKTKLNATSKYKGVYYSQKSKKFRSEIALNKKNISLGEFTDEISAAEMVDTFIVKNKLDHIPLNFPDKRNEYLQRECEIKTRKMNATGYIGVSKRDDVYLTQVHHDKKLKYIGSSKTLIIAAKKYDEYIVTNNILERKLNFPEDYPGYVTKRCVRTLFEPVDDTTIKIIISSNDKIRVLLDKNDYDVIKGYTCTYNEKLGYVSILIKKTKIHLHRFIMNETNPEIYIDHIDGNPLNNVRSNLRVSNAKKNSQNRKKKANTTSKYIGVAQDKKSKLWVAGVIQDGKELFRKRYDDELFAGRARDLFIINNLPDEHYKLNFIWTQEDQILWKEKLDNTKLINKAVNKKNPKSSSKYIGVLYSAKEKKWVARIVQRNKMLTSTHSSDEESAARKRDLTILSNNLQETFKLNFTWTPEQITEWTTKLNFTPKKITLPQP
jgi:hypothetical protein